MKQWTEEELINDGNRLRNAEITNVSLNFKDHGVLTLDLTLSDGGWGVVFGGYVLGHGYLGSENFKGSKAGLEAIMRIMDVVGVDDLIEMKGKHVRVAMKGLGHSVKIIGKMNGLITKVSLMIKSRRNQVEYRNFNRTAHCRP